MSIIVIIINALLAPQSDAEALRSTAPTYLTVETAQTHLFAARVAGGIYDIDPDLLLSLAWFESRYTVNVVGPTVRGKNACGVLQPTMETKCDASPTLLGGYIEGAAHVRQWLRASRGDMNMAMLGYAGGYALINACAEGKVLVERGGRQVDLCTVGGARLQRMRRIQHARTRAAS
jgi:hypothetical protein